MHICMYVCTYANCLHISICACHPCAGSYIYTYIHMCVYGTHPAPLHYHISPFKAPTRICVYIYIHTMISCMSQRKAAQHLR